MAYNRKKPERKNNYFTFHLIEKRGPEERSRKSYFYLGHHKPNASCICNDIQISNVGLMPSTTSSICIVYILLYSKQYMPKTYLGFPLAPARLIQTLSLPSEPFPHIYLDCPSYNIMTIKIVE